MSDVRTRLRFGIAALGVIVAGLASRRYPWLFPGVLGKYPGDALWALMVFCIWGFALPACSTGRLALCALLTCYADEFSQLYQAPGINAIRSTVVGHLVLGSTFSWFDMVAYTVGVGVGAAVRRVV
jgi:hypothetical protein